MARTKAIETRELPTDVLEFLRDNVSEKTLKTMTDYGCWTKVNENDGWFGQAGWHGELEIEVTTDGGRPHTVRVQWFEFFGEDEEDGQDETSDN